MDHEKAIAAIRAQGGNDNDVEAYLRSIGAEEIPQRRAGDKPRGFRTPEQIERENKADKANAEEGEPDYLDRLGSMAERGASALPGGALALTAARNLTKRAIGEKESWAESAAANAEGSDEGGKNAPGVNIPILGRVTLADAPAATMGFRAFSRAGIPGLSTVPRLGAAYAGATRLLSPQPESVTDRAMGTSGHALAGALIPKALEGAEGMFRMGKTLVRSKFAAPDYEANLNAREALRDANADKMYGEFRQLGVLRRTPGLNKLIGDGSDAMPGLPIIRRAVETAKGESPSLADLPDNHAAVLAEAHKIVGKKAWRDLHGFGKTEARDALLNEIEGAANERGGSLKEPVAAFRTASREVDALKTGRKALKQNTSPDGVPDRDIGKTSLDALKNNPRTEPEANAISEGILGRLDRAPKLTRLGGGVRPSTGIPVPWPSKQVRMAPKLLDAVEGRPQSSLQAMLDALSADTPTRATPPKWTPSGASADALPEGSYPMGGPRSMPDGPRRIGSGQPRLLKPSAEEVRGGEMANDALERIGGRPAIEGEAPSAISRLLRAFGDNRAGGQLRAASRREAATPSQRRLLDYLLEREAGANRP